MSNSAKRGARPTRPTLVQGVTFLGTHIPLHPFSLWFHGRQFLEGAMLFPTPATLRYHPVRDHAVCHALELMLKASLALAGATLEELAEPKFGHSLRNLLDANLAGPWGMQSPLTPEQCSEVRIASGYHSDRIYLYPAVGKLLEALKDAPDVGILIETAESLNVYLRQPCQETLSSDWKPQTPSVAAP